MAKQLRKIRFSMEDLEMIDIALMHYRMQIRNDMLKYDTDSLKKEHAKLAKLENRVTNHVYDVEIYGKYKESWEQ